MHWKAAEKVALWLTTFGALTVLAVAVGNIVARSWFSATQVPVPITLTLPSNDAVAIATPSSDLFGVTPINALSLQPTTLKIHLLGVLPNTVPEFGMAVIRPENQIEQTYIVGQNLAPGVTLKAVFSDHVVLERNGAMETLFFSQTSGSANQSLFVPSAPAASNPNSSPSTSTAIKVPQTLEQIAAAFHQHPLAMLQQAGVEQKGNSYRLTADSRLTQFGLQPGDQLVSLNGMDLDALQGDDKLQAQLLQSESIRAEIERGGQRLIIHFSIK